MDLTYWHGGAGGTKLQLRTRAEARTLLCKPGTGESVLLGLQAAGAIDLRLSLPGLDAFVVQPQAGQELAFASALDLLRPGLEAVLPALYDDAARQYVYVSRQVVVLFGDGAHAATHEAFLRARGASRVWELPFKPGGYVCEPPEAKGPEGAFLWAEELLTSAEIAEAYPIVQRGSATHRAAPEQWHLGPSQVLGAQVDASASVEVAWRHARGRGRCVAIIDPTEIDVSHREFEGRVRARLDVSRWPLSTSDDVSTVASAAQVHGTPCAGVALAGGRRASGVAPEAELIAVRDQSGLGSCAEAFGIFWATIQGADVIACPWGPPGLPQGARYAIPPHTDWAFEYAVRRGRRGLGATIVFAAGQNADDADIKGYVADPRVITVSGCNSNGRWIKRGDRGDSIACVFPTGHSARGLCIWTTGPANTAECSGRIPGLVSQEAGYRWDEGGSSAASCAVAGVIALVLEANEDLTVAQVRDVLARTSEPLPLLEEPVGTILEQAFRPDLGGRARNPSQGYGRVNAERAVLAAREARGG